jgi:hypothetical protein
VSLRNQEAIRVAEFIASTRDATVQGNVITITLISKPPKAKVTPLPKIGLKENGLDDTWCHKKPATPEERELKERSEKLRRQLKYERKLQNANRT